MPAPLWGIALLYLIWFALLVVAVPVAEIVVWFVVISFGGAVLGWTA